MRHVVDGKAYSAERETSVDRADQSPVEWVRGPLNERLTLGDLPSDDTIRWVKRRKAEVIAAIRGGLITRSEARSRYRLSDEELVLWEQAVDAVALPPSRPRRLNQ